MDIKYREEDLHQLAKKLNWSGTGAENDPIIIVSNEHLPQKFAILENKLYISINNCTFEHMDLYKCWNVSAENCSFNRLNLFYSFRNTFTKCQIHKIGFSFSSGNKFRQCSVSKTYQAFKEKNQFEECILTKSARKRLNLGLFDGADYSKILPIFILLLCFFPLFWIFEAIFSSMSLGFNLLMPILLILTFVFLYVLLIKIKNLSKKSTRSKKYKTKGV